MLRSIGDARSPSIQSVPRPAATTAIKKNKLLVFEHRINFHFFIESLYKIPIKQL